MPLASHFAVGVFTRDGADSDLHQNATLMETLAGALGGWAAWFVAAEWPVGHHG